WLRRSSWRTSGGIIHCCELLKPVANLLEAFGQQPVQPAATGGFHPHKASLAQEGKMLGDSGLGNTKLHLELFNNSSGRHGAARQRLETSPANPVSRHIKRVHDSY